MGPGESANTAQTHALTRRSALLALLLLVPAPTLGVLLAMYIAPDTPLGQCAFAFSKFWLLALPIFWAARIDHQRLRMPRPNKSGLLPAAITGLLIFAVIYAAYLLLGAAMIDPSFVSEKARSLGLRTPLIYLLGAIYWCTVNSLLEEYVWRWFVFTRCAALSNRNIAVIASAMLFTVHHVFALAVYFDWRITVLASVGVCFGGVTWAWLYARYRNIYAAWISHILADAAIFVIGYQLIFA